ncbi:hypothetical protein NCS56_01438400 [Fusarium sp. Ph1]|nr:hypothetical protein NCS56_01438400 [Fusarium sp. Ph1]
MALGASSLSAVAMMPQEGDWNAGGSIVYINATRDEVFPAVLTDNNTLGDAYIREKWFNLNSPNHTVAMMPHFAPAEACVVSSLHWEQAAGNSAKAKQSRFSLYSKIEHRLESSMAISHTSPRYFWFDSGPIIANTSVGAVVAIPSNQSDSSFDIYGCMIDARWITTTLSGDAVALLSKGYAPFSDSIATSLGGSWIGNPTYGRRVRIEPSFAEYLNPQGSRTKRTVIHEMILSSGVWTSDGEGSRSPEHLEAFLGGLATNGLARSSPRATPITTLADPKGEWWKSFMPQDGNVFGAGGSPYAVSSDDEARFYKTEMETWVTGFAFADSSLTMRGAVAVFYVYALFVIVYSVWSIWSGITSSSWGSVPDLLALALADKKPPNASRALEDDGFKSADIMKENYCISADGGTLRLRPTHGPVPYENRVKPNEAYD